MRRSLLVVLLAGFFATSAGPAVAADAEAPYKVGDRLAQPASSASSVYKERGWDALIPKDWNPIKELRALKLGALKDSDPRADEAMRKMRKLWDAAPIETSLRGERIRIAGFMVPLERKGDQITEFLLVPYFGACIHVPPPPANQIIHVITRKPLKNAQAMSAVWVSGTVDIAHADSIWGASGYKMNADVIAPYKETR
jgi:hypothetical protein